MTLQEALNEFCTRKRITHYRVAKDLGMPHAYVYQIKAGNERRAPLPRRIEIAKHIGADWRLQVNGVGGGGSEWVGVQCDGLRGTHE